jgi:16S rRNA (cytidine1402-2'-O)-methyltransferase
MLYLVPTPIGNLEDMTLRSIRVLKEVQYVLAEDTRTSKRLLDHYEIKTQLRAFHAHNEHKALAPVLEQLKSGIDIALISDAGTPGISDPGFLLARACKQEGIQVVCLPGATAFVPALASSGLPSDTFHFEGFLPHKKGRQTRLTYLATLPHTFILYESPFRLVKCLEELQQHCGPDRLACVAREISKMFEEINTQPLSALAAHYTAKPPKGEIVVLVTGAAEKKGKSKENDEPEPDVTKKPKKQNRNPK